MRPSLPARAAPRLRTGPAGRLLARALCGGLLGALTLVAAPGVRAQVIGVVKTTDDLPAFETAIDAMRKTAGGELVASSLQADKSQWPKVKAELAKKSPAVWVPVGPLALEQVLGGDVGGPIVFMMIPSDKAVPPGAHAVAGVTMRVPIDAQFKEIHHLLPAVKKIGVLYDPANTQDDVNTATKAAGDVGAQLIPGQVKDPGSLGPALQALLDQKIEALWMVADRTVTPPGSSEAMGYIAETTLKAGVPVIGYAPKLTEAGALFSVGPDFADIGAQAGEIVKKVAGGASADSIGIQPARKAALTLNLKIAGALGLTLPADAQSRATQVFK